MRDPATNGLGTSGDGGLAALHRRWTRADSVALALVTAVAAAVRVVRATSPSGGVFDEGYYVGDACLTVLSSAECPADAVFASGHPPLGSWLIGVGVRLLGYRTGGWRAAPLIAGTLTVALLYLLARRLLRSTLGATLASGLLAVEFLHVVHSRTAMLDVFVALFAVAGFLFVVYDAGSSAVRPPGRIRRPWRVAAGVAGGAAAATKWSGIPILLGLVAVTAVLEVASRRRAGARRPIASAIATEAASIVALFVALPALVYVAAHAGRIDGALLAAPWAEGSWARAFVERQGEMLDLQTRLGPLGPENPYTSPAWSWPLLARPVVYSFDLVGGAYRVVLALGNPLVWWASVPALAYAIVRWVRARLTTEPETVVAIGFLAAWAPWLALSTSRSYMFSFYMLPAVPFMCLALACAVLALGRARIVAASVALGGSVALFAFFYPVLTALPVEPGAWERRIWFGFASCGIERPAAGELPHRPLLEDRTPPAGWCWI